MKITERELRRLEELHEGGTFVDPTVLEEARAARRGLEIDQDPNWFQSLVLPKASGGVGIVVSLEMENVSDRIIRPKAARLQLPWPDADFHWLKKPSSKEVRERGGYVLAACGTHEFHPSVVLNHRFGRDLELYPGDSIEGFLLGVGTASVPDTYPNYMRVPARLTVFTGKCDSYGAWVELALMREEQPRRRKSAGKEVQRRTVREKLFA
jgi:hypothetical protein